MRGLLATGIITLARLQELHAGNPLADEDRAKMDRSLYAVAVAEAEP